MDLRQTVVDNLKQIEAAIAAPLPEFRTNSDFMRAAMELTNYAQYFLNLAISLTGSKLQAERGYTSDRASYPGSCRSSPKLYEAFRYHVSKNQREICSIFTRPLFEAIVKARYLMKARNSSFKNFVLIAYRPEKEMLADLKKKEAARPLIQIEKRMLSTIRRRLKEDRISVKVLTTLRSWELDGKNMRLLLEAMGHEPSGYPYLYGTCSHWLHGDWYDLRVHHLKKAKGRYTPKWAYTTPDPRVVCPMTALCLAFVNDFITWNRSKPPDRLIRPILHKTLEAVSRLDNAHEISLHTSKN